MYNIEAVSDDLIAFLTARLPARLAVIVADRGSDVPVSPPVNYYLGEWDIYTPYRLPAGFVIPMNSPLDLTGQTVDKWEHRLMLAFLTEGMEADKLTRACMRIAEAAFQVVKDQDVAGGRSTAREAIVQVRAVSWGPTLAKARGEKTLRCSVALELNIKHKDLPTPVG